MKGNDELKKWENEKEAFVRMKPNLLMQDEYKEKYIAVYQGQIIDCDLDALKLTKRVYEQQGYLPIYFGKVSTKVDVVELDSPEDIVNIL